jgi:hypothetical protein
MILMGIDMIHMNSHDLNVEMSQALTLAPVRWIWNDLDDRWFIHSPSTPLRQYRGKAENAPQAT